MCLKQISPTEDDRSSAQLVAFFECRIRAVFLLKGLSADFVAAKWEINMASTARYIWCERDRRGENKRER